MEFSLRPSMGFGGKDGQVFKKYEEDAAQAHHTTAAMRFRFASPKLPCTTLRATSHIRKRCPNVTVKAPILDKLKICAMVLRHGNNRICRGVGNSPDILSSPNISSSARVIFYIILSQTPIFL